MSSSSNRKRSLGDANSSEKSVDDGDRKMPAVQVRKISDIVKSPRVGLRLDMRDDDHIWSSARVVKIKATRKGSMQVTVRYDGWPESFDETALWSSKQLAPLFSFTKLAKCFVDVLHKNKKTPTRAELEALPPKANQTYSNLWPCVVQLRMPHPFVDGMDDEDDCFYAEQFLRDEPKVFVRPYCPMLLPAHVRDAFDLDDGKWLSTKRLRIWTETPSKHGVLPKNFDEAFEAAKNDKETVGVLPAGAFEKRSLLKAVFRVHNRYGVTQRDGALREENAAPGRLRQAKVGPMVTNPHPVEVKAMQEDTTQNIPPAPGEEMEVPLEKAPPPSLPPPIEISQPIHDGCGVKRCKETNQWTASMCMGGNEVFLGSFPTQTQAYQATRIAAGEDVQMDTDLRKAQLADLLAVPIEAIIEAKEKHYVPSLHDFSIHDYSLQLIRHEAWVLQQAGNERSGSTVQAAPANETVQSPRKNKRKGVPRKVDVERQCFVDDG